MIEIDTVRIAMQYTIWHPGDELSDVYLTAIDSATDPKVTRQRWSRAVRGLRELAEDSNDEFIRRQLNNFESPEQPIGLEERYDSAITQINGLLINHGRQQGWDVLRSSQVTHDMPQELQTSVQERS